MLRPEIRDNLRRACRGRLEDAAGRGDHGHPADAQERSGAHQGPRALARAAQGPTPARAGRRDRRHLTDRRRRGGQGGPGSPARPAPQPDVGRADGGRRPAARRDLRGAARRARRARRRRSAADRAGRPPRPARRRGQPGAARSERGARGHDAAAAPLDPGAREGHAADRGHAPDRRRGSAEASPKLAQQIRTLDPAEQAFRQSVLPSTAPLAPRPADLPAAGGRTFTGANAMFRPYQTRVAEPATRRVTCSGTSRPTSNPRRAAVTSLPGLSAARAVSCADDRPRSTAGAVAAACGPRGSASEGPAQALLVPGRSARAPGISSTRSSRRAGSPSARTVLVLQLIAALIFVAYTLIKKDIALPVLPRALLRQVILPDAAGPRPGQGAGSRRRRRHRRQGRRGQLEERAGARDAAPRSRRRGQDLRRRDRFVRPINVLQALRSTSVQATPGPGRCPRTSRSPPTAPTPSCRSTSSPRCSTPTPRPRSRS